MEFNSVLNRVDTSSGSTYSPKVLPGERLNLREIIDTNRKTNFHLGFKREPCPSSQQNVSNVITRNITIISEEDEPPASFHKNSKLENSKNPANDKRRSSVGNNAFVIKKNT